jgi:FkbM family methyltransferase
MSEDTKILEDREKQAVWEYFGKRRDGFFVEVGANDPKNGSQTWLLEQQGWRGVLVEPQSALYEKLVEVRKNSKVHRAACGAPEKRGKATLHLATHDGFATMQLQEDSLGINFCGTETVDLVTLDDILAKEGGPKVDFLSIDVEGFELDVLSGFSLENVRPALVLMEDAVRNLDKHRYMTSHGYKLVKRTVLNNWYVPRETKFTMSTFGERMELFRKMYLATPIRQWRLAARRRREQKKA